MPDGTTTSAVPLGASLLRSAIDRATASLISQQGSDGGFEGEVVWCPVITAQVAIAKIVTGRQPNEESKAAILRHFAATRRPDGGWGLHPESHSYRFVTVLVYVAARLLGVAADDPLLAPARAFLASTPDDVWGLPSWGKFWLSLLGVYDRRDLHPIPPEIFLIPRSFPLSPYRFHCHTRYILLGFAYLWGRGAVFDIGPMARELRYEIFGTDRRGSRYSERHALAATDAYVRPSQVLRISYEVMRAAEAARRLIPGAKRLRDRALDHCRSAILFEQSASNFQGLSPVNGVLNTLALWFDDPEGEATERSVAGLDAWAWWDGSDELRYAGARSGVWDTAFAVQALSTASDEAPKISLAVARAIEHLRSLQLVVPLEGAAPMQRDPVEGGWCFGSNAHRWPVSDCTAEVLSAIGAARHHLSPSDMMGPTSLADAVRFILSRQNDDGGFATYERRRGNSLLEHLNPTELFGQCMTERSYIECTGSCLRALAEVRSLIQDAALHDRMISALRQGRDFLLSQQSSDGSWPGFWGINRIYGTLFALWGLRAAGCDGTHPALCRAAAWLRATQRSDGAWGEHFSGCLSQSYVPSEKGRISSTAWAMLALLAATDGVADASVERAAAWLVRQQEQGGGWPHDGVNGAFFGTAMIDYRLYSSIFPLWALSEHLRRREAAHD